MPCDDFDRQHLGIERQLFRRSDGENLGILLLESRVFLDNTPQTIVIKSGNAEDESLFGTRPITKTSLQIKRCTQYASKAAGGKRPGTDGTADSARAEYYQGTWTGSTGWLTRPQLDS